MKIDSRVDKRRVVLQERKDTSITLQEDLVDLTLFILGLGARF